VLGFIAPITNSLIVAYLSNVFDYVYIGITPDDPRYNYVNLGVFLIAEVRPLSQFVLRPHAHSVSICSISW